MLLPVKTMDTVQKRVLSPLYLQNSFRVKIVGVEWHSALHAVTDEQLKKVRVCMCTYICMNACLCLCIHVCM